ncbi:MAG: radical SAM protein, partial [Candidatus Omnitrophica bacterium]|nr:radical SAM protein [Candidatus Omnitrophota bacterium]
MKYIYGPISSRRLGLSLGVSLIPHKTCDFDCVYCQLGQTFVKTALRKEYVAKDEIVAQVKEWLSRNPDKKIDYITFSGYGEPALNIKLAEIIQEIKNFSKTKIAVITNSSLLVESAVRRSLALADLVLPSLDAATQEVFEKIDRP